MSIVRMHASVKLMADGPSFLYQKLVYENLGTRNLSVRHKFSYEFFSRTRNLDELEQCSFYVHPFFFTIFCCW